MFRRLYGLLGGVASIGLCALPAMALEGSVSPALESVQRVFCLNTTTGESLDAIVTMDADGNHRYDCSELAGTTGDAMSILVQGTFVEATPPPPPLAANCVELLTADTVVGDFTCSEDVPDNNPTSLPAGLIGDVYTFTASAGASGTVTIDTVDRGDGLANLAPGLILLAPNGIPIEGAVNEVDCTVPPVCGGRCPQMSGTIAVPGAYQLIVVDTPGVDDTCNGGDYSMMTTGVNGLSFTGIADDVNTGQVTLDP